LKDGTYMLSEAALVDPAHADVAGLLAFLPTRTPDAAIVYGFAEARPTVIAWKTAGVRHVGPFDTNPGPFDVFLVAGQSNSFFGASFDASLDTAATDVWQWGHAGRLIRSGEPLEHVTTTPDRIGYAVTFARDYYVPNVGRPVLLVGAAAGGTGFADHRWRVGDDLYLNAVARTNAAMASRVGNVFKGVLWHQGEEEALAGWTKAQHIAALDAMIAGFRAAITGASNARVVVGGMVPEWVAASATRQPVQDALSETPGRVANTGYADPTGLAGIAGNEIHYSAASQRTLAGRYWTAYAG